MFFNSIEFAFFVPIVFFVYWFILNKNLRLQNLFLLGASYFFYGWWDWRFLSLIIFSSFIDYFVGAQLGKTEDFRKRKYLLGLSIFVNLGFLGFFKYYNFFAESFAETFTMIGVPFDVQRLNIILPIGISFYTFQTLSYSIDVYRKKLKPTKDITAFFAFVSFFPQLVAGPIERATNLLPQFHKNRIFDNEKARDGMRQILWGLFKKIVIADNCAFIVNEIFYSYTAYSASALVIGIIFFAFQIYGDFSGYSDIAIGTARLFGFNLMKNFDFPYFSTSTSELWRRWHMSLSQFANEYLFTPLTIFFSTLKKKAVLLSLFLTFLIIGLWHGANWTFIVFGIWNGLVMCIEHIAIRQRNLLKRKYSSKLIFFLGWVITMFCWFIGMLFFRSANIKEAFSYLSHMISPSLFSVPTNASRLMATQIVLIFIFIIVEWRQRDKEHALEIKRATKQPLLLRWSYYVLIIFAMVAFYGVPQEFIYFQF